MERWARKMWFPKEMRFCCGGSKPPAIPRTSVFVGVQRPKQSNTREKLSSAASTLLLIPHLLYMYLFVYLLFVYYSFVYLDIFRYLFYFIFRYAIWIYHHVFTLYLHNFMSNYLTSQVYSKYKPRKKRFRIGFHDQTSPSSLRSNQRHPAAVQCGALREAAEPKTGQVRRSQGGIRGFLLQFPQRIDRAPKK